MDHLMRLRALQDETKGFMALIPLSFHPEGTRIPVQHPSGFDDLRNLAVSRLVLDNFDHIKAYWTQTGLKLAQLGLSFGADDIDGTVVEETITHMAGAKSPKGVTEQSLRDLILAAGRIPVRRDTLHRDLERAAWRINQRICRTRSSTPASAAPPVKDLPHRGDRRAQGHQRSCPLHRLQACSSVCRPTPSSPPQRLSPQRKLELPAVIFGRCTAANTASTSAHDACPSRASHRPRRLGSARSTPVVGCGSASRSRQGRHRRLRQGRKTSTIRSEAQPPATPRQDARLWGGIRIRPLRSARWAGASARRRRHVRRARALGEDQPSRCNDRLALRCMLAEGTAAGSSSTPASAAPPSGEETEIYAVEPRPGWTRRRSRHPHPPSLRPRGGS